MEDNKLEKEENLVEETKEENNGVLENTEDFTEEIIEENKVLVEDFENENEGEKIKKKPGFLKKLLSGIIDQILSIAISLLLLVSFDAIIKLFGFYIADREPMFLIIYIITNVLYRPILEATKLKETIGGKLIK